MDPGKSTERMFQIQVYIQCLLEYTIECTIFCDAPATLVLQLLHFNASLESNVLFVLLF